MASGVWRIASAIGLALLAMGVGIIFGCQATVELEVDDLTEFGPPFALLGCSSKVMVQLPYPCLEPLSHILPHRLPQPSPLEGVYKSNKILKKAKRMFDGQIHGSESVAIVDDGHMYMLDKYGALRRAHRAGAGGWEMERHPLTHLGPGRPLGFHQDKDGNLIVCNAGHGLQLVERDTHRVVLLTDRSSNNVPIRYANDLDIAANGTVYFTDSQAFGPVLNSAGFFDTLSACILGIAQGSPDGRLLAYHPASGETQVVADDVWWANGVALSAAEDFVAVAETAGFRVHRQWLKGPKAGTRDILIDKLPGFPDGVVRSRDGKGFWISLVLPPRNLLVKALPARWARFIVAWVPAWARPKPAQWGCIVQVSEEGRVLRMLMDPDGRHISSIASVVDADEHLFLGNLNGDYISTFDKAELPPINEEPK